MNSRAAAQALVPGRVIMTADSSSGLTELGVVCGAVPPAKAGIHLGSSTAAGMPCDALCRAFWAKTYRPKPKICCMAAQHEVSCLHPGQHLQDMHLWTMDLDMVFCLGCCMLLKKYPIPVASGASAQPTADI